MFVTLTSFQTCSGFALNENLNVINELTWRSVSHCQDGDDDDEDWAEETTAEAQRRRMEEISDHAKNLTLSEDLEKPLEERVNLFYNFVKVRAAETFIKPQYTKTEP